MAGAGAAAGVLANEALTDDPVDHASAAAAAVPFHGGHQAGIVTPAQDRMHFVALDVRTKDRDELMELLKDWTVAAERMTQGLEEAERRGRRRPGSGSGGHRRGTRPAGAALTLTDRLRRVTVRRPLRPEGQAAARVGPTAEVPGGRPGPGPLRRRHLHPGVRQRSPGRGTRDPQPRPPRFRQGGRPLVAAGFRSHVVDNAGTGDTS